MHTRTHMHTRNYVHTHTHTHTCTRMGPFARVCESVSCTQVQLALRVFAPFAHHITSCASTSQHVPPHHIMCLHIASCSSTSHNAGPANPAAGLCTLCASHPFRKYRPQVSQHPHPHPTRAIPDQAGALPNITSPIQWQRQLQQRRRRAAAALAAAAGSSARAAGVGCGMCFWGRIAVYLPKALVACNAENPTLPLCRIQMYVCLVCGCECTCTCMGACQVCVCVCARAWTCVCVCTCVHVCAWVCVLLCQQHAHQFLRQKCSAVNGGP